MKTTVNNTPMQFHSVCTLHNPCSRCRPDRAIENAPPLTAEAAMERYERWDARAQNAITESARRECQDIADSCWADFEEADRRAAHQAAIRLRGDPGIGRPILLRANGRGPSVLEDN
jgi:hypothetical protein